MPSATFEITEGGHDGHVAKTSDPGSFNFFNTSGAHCDFGDAGAAAFDYAMFLEYTVNVPQGATITAATLDVIANNSITQSATMVIRASDADDTAAPTTASEANSRVLTTEQANWPMVTFAAGNPYTSADFANVVQEVVNRPGWVSGNRMVIWVDHDVSGWGGVVNKREIRSYNWDPLESAELNVTWTTASNATPAPATVAAAVSQPGANPAGDGTVVPQLPNQIVNPTFDTDISNWDQSWFWGAGLTATHETTDPITGAGSFRLGPNDTDGQRYAAQKFRVYDGLPYTITASVETSGALADDPAILIFNTGVAESNVYELFNPTDGPWHTVYAGDGGAGTGPITVTNTITVPAGQTWAGALIGGAPDSTGSYWVLWDDVYITAQVGAYAVVDIPTPLVDPDSAGAVHATVTPATVAVTAFPLGPAGYSDIYSDVYTLGLYVNLSAQQGVTVTASSFTSTVTVPAPFVMVTPEGQTTVPVTVTIPTPTIPVDSPAPDTVAITVTIDTPDVLVSFPLDPVAATATVGAVAVDVGFGATVMATTVAVLTTVTVPQVLGSPSVGVETVRTSATVTVPTPTIDLIFDMTVEAVTVEAFMLNPSWRVSGPPDVDYHLTLGRRTYEFSGPFVTSFRPRG